MIRFLPLLALAGCATGQNLTLNPDKPPVVTADGATAVPGCPDWTQEQVAQSAPATSRNFGCASQHNLAAMLDDPRDLLRGRTGPAGAAGTTSVKAIRMWRDAPPSGKAMLDKEVKAETAGGGSGGGK